MNYQFTNNKLFYNISFFYFTKKLEGSETSPNIKELYSELSWNISEQELLSTLNEILLSDIYLDRFIEVAQSYTDWTQRETDSYVYNLLIKDKKDSKEKQRLVRYIMTIYYKTYPLDLLEISHSKQFIPERLRDEPLYKILAILIDYIQEKYFYVSASELKKVEPEALDNILSYNRDISEEGLYLWNFLITPKSGTKFMLEVLLRAISNTSIVYETEASLGKTDSNICRYDLTTGAERFIPVRQSLRNNREGIFDIESSVAITDENELDLLIDTIDTYKPYETSCKVLRDPEANRQMILSGGSPFLQNLSVISGIPGVKRNKVYIDYQRVFSDTTNLFLPIVNLNLTRNTSKHIEYRLSLTSTNYRTKSYCYNLISSKTRNTYTMHKSQVKTDLYRYYSDTNILLKDIYSLELRDIYNKSSDDISGTLKKEFIRSEWLEVSLSSLINLQPIYKRFPDWVDIHITTVGNLTSLDLSYIDKLYWNKALSWGKGLYVVKDELRSIFSSYKNISETPLSEIECSVSTLTSERLEVRDIKDTMETLTGRRYLKWSDDELNNYLRILDRETDYIISDVTGTIQDNYNLSLDKLYDISSNKRIYWANDIRVIDLTKKV
ncbi:hypothetical protein ThvES_00008020 [Thiovulum sp. ES]|nr:hypothetical protein ThvES_00008020 [Thiovulum sp. ES]